VSRENECGLEAYERLLWEGWNSENSAENYIADSVQRERQIDELTAVVNEYLVITPIVNFVPRLINVESVYSFQEDWSIREFVWMSENEFVFMSRVTAAQNAK
jgi:hypothetical protein